MVSMEQAPIPRIQVANDVRSRNLLFFTSITYSQLPPKIISNPSAFELKSHILHAPTYYFSASSINKNVLQLLWSNRARVHHAQKTKVQSDRSNVIIVCNISEVSRQSKRKRRERCVFCADTSVIIVRSRLKN